MKNSTWEEVDLNHFGASSLVFFEHPFCLFLHAELQESKTEDPTEHKKKKSREEGHVFFSQDLVQSATLLVGLGVLFVTSGSLFQYFLQFLVLSWDQSMFVPVQGSMSDWSNMGWRGIRFWSVCVVPSSVFCLATTILVTMSQTGGYISLVKIKPDFSKVAPSWTNFKKKFALSFSQITSLFKSLIKIGVISLIFVFFLFVSIEDIFLLSRFELWGIFARGNVLLCKLIFVVILFLLSFSIPDWFLQKREYQQSLMMTKHEIKQESKELEGDPSIKQKVKDRARQLSAKKLVENIKTSDVVITNPTHFACAIKYDMDSMPAPKLVAKGQDNIALQIRKLAKIHKIPTIENKPLARSLYENIEINTVISPEYYVAVADILSALDKFKGVKK